MRNGIFLFLLQVVWAIRARIGSDCPTKLLIERREGHSEFVGKV
jgi:hypothetical protein